MLKANCILFLLLLSCGSLKAQNEAIPGNKQIIVSVSQDPVKGVINLFDKYPVVALSEAHRLQEEHDFIDRLLKDTAFPEKVNDIVIEWGNSRYQKVLDKYIVGENIDISDLRKVWRDTGFSSWTWDAPVYEKLFKTVREINEKLPAAKKIRVIAGDVPVDWTKSAKQINEIQEKYPRDKHFADIIEKEVFSKNRKALIVMGMGHLLRYKWDPYSGSDKPQTTIDFLCEKHSKEIFVIMVHAFLRRNAELESKLSTVPAPSFIMLKDTWLGELPTDSVMSKRYERGFANGKVAFAVVNPYVGLSLQDIADGYLYLGDMNELTESQPSPELYSSDLKYVGELQRRFKMMTGQNFPVEHYLKKRDQISFIQNLQHFRRLQNKNTRHRTIDSPQGLCEFQHKARHLPQSFVQVSQTR